jgi:3-oxoacyl-[acyl-carrier protein] reductase
MDTAMTDQNTSSKDMTQDTNTALPDTASAADTAKADAQSIPTAIVTGGSGGIGRSVCVALAAKGCNVVVGYSGHEENAEETRRLCVEAAGNSGASFLICRADVSKKADCAALSQAAMELSGRIDILVNCAGITRDGLLMTMSEEDFDTVLDINLKGTFLMSQAVSRQMLRQRYGRIINLSSVVGIHGNAGQTNYAASKAGVIGFTKSLAKELAGRKITVNAVAPGFIETKMTEAMPEKAREAVLSSIPAKRAGQTEEVAAAVVFLASFEAAYITGQVLGVDGGME